jgi:hypothetical protein
VTLFLKKRNQKVKHVITYKSKCLSALLFTILTCSLVISGCLREEAPTTPAFDSLAIKNLSLQFLNNSTYITGIAENVGNKNISDLFIEASGYNENNTILLKRGYADSMLGIKPIIPPGDKSPFMIRLFDVVNKSYTNTSEKTMTPNSTINATKNLKLDILNQNPRNITQGNATAKSSVSSYYNTSVASYKVKPHYKESSEKPYSLVVVNNKTIDGIQKIIVAGEIYNNGTKVLNSSVVAAALYRRDGAVLGVFLNHVTVQILPEKTSAFQIEILKKDFSINIKEIAFIEIYAYMIK